MKWIEREFLRYRVAFGAVALFLLFLVALLPFSIASVLEDILGVPAGKMYSLFGATGASVEDDLYAHFHITVVTIDESQQMATLRVVADRRCRTNCPEDVTLTLASFHAWDLEDEDPPALAKMTLKGTIEDASQTVILPVSGNPIQYPFDHYRLRLAFALEVTPPGASPRPITEAEAAGQVRVTMREHLTRMSMEPPELMPDESAEVVAGRVFFPASLMTFERPLYLRVLAIALVLLITSAAAGAVFMKPIPDLFISSGSLIIGVWGVRSVLVPGLPSYVTAVDLSLSVVIMFLLGAIIVRLATYFHHRGDLPRPVPRLRGSRTARRSGEQAGES